MMRAALLAAWVALGCVRYCASIDIAAQQDFSAFACGAAVGNFAFRYGGARLYTSSDSLSVLNVHRMDWSSIVPLSKIRPPGSVLCSMTAIPATDWEVHNSEWKSDNSTSATLIEPGNPSSWPVGSQAPPRARLLLFDTRVSWITMDEPVQHSNSVWLFDTESFHWSLQETYNMEAVVRHDAAVSGRRSHAAVLFFDNETQAHTLLIHGGKSFMLLGVALRLQVVLSLCVVLRPTGPWGPAWGPGVIVASTSLHEAALLD